MKPFKVEFTRFLVEKGSLKAFELDSVRISLRKMLLIAFEINFDLFPVRQSSLKVFEVEFDRFLVRKSNHLFQPKKKLKKSIFFILQYPKARPRHVQPTPWVLCSAVRKWRYAKCSSSLRRRTRLSLSWVKSVPFNSVM